MAKKRGLKWATRVEELVNDPKIPNKSSGRDYLNWFKARGVPDAEIEIFFEGVLDPKKSYTLTDIKEIVTVGSPELRVVLYGPDEKGYEQRKLKYPDQYITDPGIGVLNELVIAAPFLEPYTVPSSQHYGDVANHTTIAWARYQYRPIDYDNLDRGIYMFVDEIQSDRVQGIRRDGMRAKPSLPDPDVDFIRETTTYIPEVKKERAKHLIAIYETGLEDYDPLSVFKLRGDKFSDIAAQAQQELAATASGLSEWGTWGLVEKPELFEQVVGNIEEVTENLFGTIKSNEAKAFRASMADELFREWRRVSQSHEGLDGTMFRAACHLAATILSFNAKSKEQVEAIKRLEPKGGGRKRSRWVIVKDPGPGQAMQTLYTGAWGKSKPKVKQEWIESQRNLSGRYVPWTPWKTADAYIRLVMKELIHQAIINDAKAIFWINGYWQAQRWGKSESNLITFYDELVPNVTKKLIKKFGGRLTKSTAEDMGLIDYDMRVQNTQNIPDSAAIFQGFFITDKMRAAFGHGDEQYLINPPRVSGDLFS
jgi:hypothetical protein